MEGELLEGKCLFMCPLSEQTRRQQQNRLSVFEILPNATSRISSRLLAHEIKAVKEYARPAAGKVIDLELIRPIDVLLKTIRYLINSVANRQDKPWAAIYSFVSNRIRAIKQDLTIQRCKGNKAILVLELATRFYLCSELKMVDAPVEEFDPILNKEQLLDAIYKLLELYIDDTANCSNQAEFESYNMLYNLDTEGIKVRAMLMNTYFRESVIFQHALRICKAAWQKNYVRFFKLISKSSYLCKCAVLRHVYRIRREAIQTMNIAYGNRASRFPIEKLAQILQFKEYSLAEEFSSAHGIEVICNQLTFTKKPLIAFQDRRFNTIASTDDDISISAIIAPG